MKSFRLLLVLSFFTRIALGQTQFQTTTGSAADDLGYQIAALADGSIIATGGTEAVAGNGWDSYLVKFNPYGEVLWASTFGDMGDEISWDLLVTQSNEIVGVGVSGSLGTPHSGATIAKLDTSGTVLWLTGVYDLNGQVDFYRVLETSTGHFLATGLISTTANQDDILLCKFSASGNLLWSKSIGSAQADEIMGITETPEGHYLMAGLTNDNTGNGSSDFAAVKTDTAGNVIWKKNYGGSGSDRMNDVLVINGSYYFCGWSSSVGQGSSDIVLMKTDTAGSVNWVKSYGTTENDRAFNMLYNSSDSVIVLAGYTDYSGGTSTNRNSFLMSVDLAGNMNWDKSYGSTGRDGHWPTGLTHNGDEGYYVLGTSNSFSSGDDDLYLVKTDAAGNTACNLKDPQFTEATVSGWPGTSFGSSLTISLSSNLIPLTGSTWNISASSECCLLYADAGPDTGFCPMDSVQIGTPGIPGYSYNWSLNANTLSSEAVYMAVDSGTYYLSVSAAGSGCVTVTDTVVVSTFPGPPKPSITVVGSTQLSSDPSSSYQWFFNGDSISGADQQTFTYSDTGYYQVMVSNSFGCSSISDSILMTGVGLEEYPELLNMSVYPNPSTGWLYLKFRETGKNVSLAVYDVSGNRVYNRSIGRMEKSQRQYLDLGFLAAGLYYLRLTASEGNAHLPIVIGVQEGR